MTAIAKPMPVQHGGRGLAPAALACMGVVFGDIGTSPLYALNVAGEIGQSLRRGLAARPCSASSR